MSYTIRDGSPKQAAAQQFAAELQRALASRGLSMKALNRALGGTSQTRLWHYSSARLLPRLSSAIEIAEALAWPRLAEIVREARTLPCAQCGRLFVMEGGSANKRYCRASCRSAALALRAHLGQAENADEDPERRLVGRVKAELDLVAGSTRPVSRRALRDAVGEYESSSPQSRRRRMQNSVDEHIAAVEAFCNGCEPEGICRDAGCALRRVSPLPLGVVREVAFATPAEGAWGPANYERRAELQRDVNAVRWSKPGEKARQSARTRASWQAMTPEERRQRVQHAIGVREGHYAQCGCPRNRGHRQGCQFRRGRRVPST